MNYIFLLGLAVLCVHELDAIRCKEWRIIPGLSLLPCKAGQIIFIIAHIPILFVMFHLFRTRYNLSLMFGFNIFMMLHTMLHLLFITHKKNEFRDITSWILIVTPGLCAACHSRFLCYSMYSIDYFLF